MLTVSDEIVDPLHSFLMPCVAVEREEMMLMCWMRVSSATQGASKASFRTALRLRRDR